VWPSDHANQGQKEKNEGKQRKQKIIGERRGTGWQFIFAMFLRGQAKKRERS
jgi:hypothetical protein